MGDTVARRIIYRDEDGEFISKAEYLRALNEGREVRSQYIDAPDDNTITNTEQLSSLFQDWFDEYGDPEDWIPQEYHGAGDYGDVE